MRASLYRNDRASFLPVHTANTFYHHVFYKFTTCFIQTDAGEGIEKRDGRKTMKKKTKRTGHFNRALALLFTALLVLQAAALGSGLSMTADASEAADVSVTAGTSEAASAPDAVNAPAAADTAETESAPEAADVSEAVRKRQMLRKQ